MKYFLLILGCLSLIPGCKIFSNKKRAEALSISFGSGGGFTGGVEEFILKKNGEMTGINSIRKDTITLQRVEKRVVSNMFKAIQADTLAAIELNEVGNFNYFIILMKGDKISRSFHWTDGSHVPGEILNLYQSLMALPVKNIK